MKPLSADEVEAYLRQYGFVRGHGGNVAMPAGSISKQDARQPFHTMEVASCRKVR